MSRAGDTNPLAVELAGVELQSPLMLGSGSLGETALLLEPFQRPSVGAVVTRTLRGRDQADRQTFPVPHLHVEPKGRYALNCEWGSRVGADYWIDEGLRRAAQQGRVVVSVSGRDIDDCVSVCDRLPHDLVTFVELNVSCSHAGELYGRVGDDAEHVFNLVRAVREVLPRPPIVKLAYSTAIGAVAQAAERAGALAITSTNSIGPGLDVDPNTGRPLLGLEGGFGGVSGPAILPFALRSVDLVRRAVDLPVIGVGGISSTEHAVKMLMVGATCLQVYTAAEWRGPEAFDRLRDGLIRYLEEHGLGRISELTGRSRPFLSAKTRLEPVVPVVDPDRCSPCPRCQTVCPVDAISVSDHAEIDGAACVGCGVCIDACPPSRAAIGSTLRPHPKRPTEQKAYVAAAISSTPTYHVGYQSEQTSGQPLSPE